MQVRILSWRDVRELLPMRECMDRMAAAHASLARGEGSNPLRKGIRLARRGDLIGLMPGELGSPHAAGFKAVAVYPSNHGSAYDSHQGVVVLFDTEHGNPIAILDASEVTAIRTAAVSGVATEQLAREDAGDLALLGSGVQARSHLAAMACARTLRRVRVHSPRPERRARFVQWAREHIGLEVEDCASARSAVEGADLVCTTTSSHQPVLLGEWLSQGAHVNAVGSSMPKAVELDAKAVARARLFVDRRESTLAESGDFLAARAAGAVGDDHIVAELGDVLLERHPGRTGEHEITLYESLGLAIQDLAAAHHVLQRAEATGRGALVELGPGPDDA